MELWKKGSWILAEGFDGINTYMDAEVAFRKEPGRRITMALSVDTNYAFELGGKLFFGQYADYPFDKAIKSDDRATTMEMIASLDGYSIGSGMLSGEDAILKGLVSIKLEEEDPLTIGYIVRNGSRLSSYGKAYVEELLRFREL